MNDDRSPDAARWCGAGYAVVHLDPEQAPEWPSPKDPPCMNPGVMWFAVLLDDSRFAARFWLCEEHTAMIRQRFAVIDKYGYTPPGSEP
jgi:hypothetical protein